MRRNSSNRLSNSYGFSLLELVLTITLMSLAIAITASIVNFNSTTVTTTCDDLMNSLTSIESAALNYSSDKSIMPSSLTDTAFVPTYLFPPKAPKTFDASYGTSGYYLAQQTGQTSPNNGYYVCARATVTSSTDTAFAGILAASEKMSAAKFFYNTTCPATSNMATPSSSTTVYTTYWFTRY